MKRIYRVEQVRTAERAMGEELTSGRLMAQAAAGLAREVTADLAERGRRVFGARVVVVVGPGDNGGDGLYAAATLARRGAHVTVWRCFSTYHAAGWAALRAAGGRPVEAAEALAALARADVVIDAVFGIGARPGLPDAIAAFAGACRAAGVPVVSADLPSGLEADACLPAPATAAGPSSFWAARTVSFGAWKPCHVAQPARDRCGARRLIDIGLDFRGIDLAGELGGRVGPDVGGGPGEGPGVPGKTDGRVGQESGGWPGEGSGVPVEADGPVGLPRSHGRETVGVAGQPEGRAGSAEGPAVQPYAEEVELADLAAEWPWPDAESDKYSRGVVGVDTGSVEYPGAAVLGVLGAIHAGAGYVVYVGPARANVLAAAPNVVCPVLPEEPPGRLGFGPDSGSTAVAALPAGSPTPARPRVNAWLIGSGWGTRPGAAGRLARVLADGVPVVIDAEGIGLFGAARAAGDVTGAAPVLLTPHAGELARLLGVNRSDVEAEPVAAVQRACRLTDATVLLKGATQYVATPGDATTYLCFPGPAWTAQAGSGDVLAGIAAALLAAGLPPARAALLAGSIQALAAVRHPGPYPPQELIHYLPEVIASLR